MKRKVKKVIIYILAFYLLEFALIFPLPSKETRTNNPLPPEGKILEIDKNDRILIVSPHPDDAALSSSGIISKAISKGAKVKILYITCGSHNTAAMIKDSIVHTVTPVSGLLLGETRYREAMCAMKSLGVSKANIVFLGFPDFGTLKIWTDHFNNTPYFSGITMHNKTFYPFVYRKDIPFTAFNEIKLIEEILKNFKPTKIVYTPTMDLNSDHRATGLFIDAAVFDLRNEIHPELYQYFMHAEGWPEPEKFELNTYISKPNFIRNLTGQWFNYFLTSDEEHKKEKAIICHKSQVKSKPDFMLSFVRKNEPFFRENEYINSKMPLWTDEEMEKLKISPFITNVYIGEKENYILYKIKLRRGFENFTKLYIFLYPEVANESFLNTTKYKVTVTRTLTKNLNVTLMDSTGKTLVHKKEELSANGNNLMLNIEVNKKYVKNSAAFFSAIQLEQADLRVSESPWWNISLKRSFQK
jgi:LmbE family N-acetylglucosaminyl deacetylase